MKDYQPRTTFAGGKSPWERTTVTEPPRQLSNVSRLSKSSIQILQMLRDNRKWMSIYEVSLEIGLPQEVLSKRLIDFVLSGRLIGRKDKSSKSRAFIHYFKYSPGSYLNAKTPQLLGREMCK